MAEGRRSPRFRRTTYLLAAGLGTVGVLAALLHSPAGGRWILARVDGVLREQTGLGIRARETRFFLNGGRLLVEGLEVGDGLLKARRLEVSVEYLSLAAGRPRIRWVRVQEPEVNLTKAGLDALKLKPATDGPSRWSIGTIEVRGGKLALADPAWGPQRVQALFNFEGSGLGIGRIDGTLRIPTWKVTLPSEQLEGQGHVLVQVSDPRTEARGELQSGADRAVFALTTRRKELDGQVRLEGDVGRAVRVAGRPGLASGHAVVEAGLTGTLEAPRWRLSLSGTRISVEQAGLSSAEVSLRAHGQPDEVHLDQLRVASPEGGLEATGGWRKSSGSAVALTLQDTSLDPLIPRLHLPMLRGVRAEARVELLHPSTLWGEWKAPAGSREKVWFPPDLDRLKATGEGRLRRADGAEGGSFVLEAGGGQTRVRSARLDLPQLRAEGQGLLVFSRRRFERVEGTATVETEVGAVADALAAWRLVMEDTPEGGERPWRMDMAGAAKAQASVSWDRASGLLLTGWVDLRKPRWVGAEADTLRSDVSIIGGALRLPNLELTRGPGRAEGSLWLSWEDLPSGAKQFDLCASAFRLPLAEGLKAADLDPEEYPLEGQVSGWVQLAGPYRQLHLQAGARGEEVRAYGLRLPAVALDLDYPLSESRMRISDLRVAENMQGISQEAAELGTTLDLRGGLDLDLQRETWRGGLSGRFDSGPLALPGPRIQAQVEARFDGPLVVHMGPTLLPTGRVDFRRGRFFFGNQSIEGVEGRVEVEPGALDIRVGLEGKANPLLQAFAWREGRALECAAKVEVGPQSADTALLGARLTSDVVQDLRLQGDVRGTWTQDGLRWKGLLSHLEGRFPGFTAGQMQPTRVEGTDQGAAFQLALAGSGSGTDTGPGAAMDIRGMLPFSKDRSMSVHFNGSADLARVKSVLDAVIQPGQGSLLADLQPAGKASLALTLGGTPAVPRLDGRLDLHGGQMRLRTYPQSAENVSFSLIFRDRTILLPEERPLMGRLALGTLSAFGRADWDLTGLKSYDLKARLHDFQFRDVPEGFELQGSADANLTGNDRGGKLKGTLDARNLLYRADVKLTDVLLASAMGGTLSGPLFDPEDPLRLIELDLDLRLAEPWQFDTNLLKLQGRPTGPFKVLGTLAQPGLRGTMEFLPGGRITNLLPAGDVVLERGSIDFKDPRTFNPVLNLLGRVDVPPFAVNLGIQGSLDQLTFSPTSTPSLRQDEIVAILVDPGLAATVGSIGSSAAGTAAHYGLASAGSGILSTLAIAGFQEQLRQTFNLDRVSFALRPGTGSPEMAFTVGKSVDLFGRRTPVVVTHRRAGEVVTLSGQLEWRFGNFVLQMGASRTGTTGVNPSGEVRWTWSPR